MRRFFLLCTTVLVMLAIGCSKITDENYNKLKTGMDYTKVVEMLGDADTCDSGMGAKTCVWGDEGKNIKIKFLVEKVVIFSKKGI